MKSILKSNNKVGKLNPAVPLLMGKYIKIFLDKFSQSYRRIIKRTL